MQGKEDRFRAIRQSIQQTGIVSKNSIKVEAKQQKIRCRRQSLQLAQDSFESERLLRKFSDEDEEEEKSLVNSFEGKYKLLDWVGEGGNAMVHTCEYRDSGKIYAVKRVKMDEQHYLELKKNFLNIKGLRHPSIIRYHALYFDHSKHLAYLVMQYFPAKNLLELNIKDQAEMKIIFTQVLQALAYLHQRNVCHRDIKPENILYDPMMKRLKIIDFGISKKTFQRGQRRDMLTIIGTYFYLPPQVFVGGGYDEKIDLWSVGVTLFKVVTGKTPFQSQYHADTIDNIIKGQPFFDQHVWSKFSFFIKDITSRLLKPRYQRLSAKEALKHLWITPDGSPGKLRRTSQKFPDVKFPRHDSGNLSVFREQVEEQILNRKNATSKEEGQKQQSQRESPPRILVKAKRINLIQNNEFDLSDSDENTSPNSATRKNIND